jgi:hypothetical protein
MMKNADKLQLKKQSIHEECGTERECGERCKIEKNIHK